MSSGYAALEKIEQMKKLAAELQLPVADLQFMADTFGGIKSFTTSNSYDHITMRYSAPRGVWGLWYPAYGRGTSY